MRAKMRVSGVVVTKRPSTEVVIYEKLLFSAVSKNAGYDEDGLDENNTFAKWTPQAELTVTVTNPALFGQFESGQEYYVDFTKVEKPE